MEAATPDVLVVDTYPAILQVMISLIRQKGHAVKALDHRALQLDDVIKSARESAAHVILTNGQFAQGKTATELITALPGKQIIVLTGDDTIASNIRSNHPNTPVFIKPEVRMEDLIGTISSMVSRASA